MSASKWAHLICFAALEGLPCQLVIAFLQSQLCPAVPLVSCVSGLGILGLQLFLGAHHLQGADAFVRAAAQGWPHSTSIKALLSAAVRRVLRSTFLQLCIPSAEALHFPCACCTASAGAAVFMALQQWTPLAQAAAFPALWSHPARCLAPVQLPAASL